MRIRMKRLALLTAGTLLASAGAYGDAPLWTVAAESYLGYELIFAGNDVDGEFTGFDARIQFDPEMPDTSRFLVVVDLEFIETRDDEHATGRFRWSCHSLSIPTTRAQHSRGRWSSHAWNTASGKATGSLPTGWTNSSPSDIG